MKYYRKIFFVLFVILCLHACQEKEEDPSHPIIQINSPPAFSVFNVWDTINVSGTVYSERPVKSLQVSLVNNSNVPVATPVGIIPELSSFDFHQELVIDNANLQSGSYFIMVKVADEYNTVRTFQPVDVNGINQELRRLLVVTKLNTLKSNVLIVDSAYNVSQILGVSKEYVGSAVSSDHQQFYYITPNPSLLMTYDLNDTVLDWEYSAQSPYPVYENIYYEDNLIYLATQNGDVIGVDYQGDRKFGTVTHNDRVPTEIYKHHDLIITDQRTRSNTFRYFTLFYASTGAFANQHQTDLEVVKFFSRNDEEIIAFGNQFDQAQVKVYTVMLNNTYEPSSMPPGKLNNAVQINDIEVLLAMDNGVFLYNMANFQYYQVIYLDNVSAMAYDPLNSLLCISVDTKIYFYNYPGSGFQNTINMNFQVLNLHFLYNN